MLTLSTIETRSQRGSLAEGEAQANARMALMIALGELQKNVGPDQRITANFSVLAHDSGQQQVLGVWKSIGDGLSDNGDLAALASAYQNSYSSEDRDGRFLRWLVSGNIREVSEISFPGTLSSPTSPKNSVNLIGPRTLGVDDDDNLTAEQQQMLVSANLVQNMNSLQPTQTAGAYAWMIGGENLKARVDFDHPDPSDRAQQLVDRGASPGTNLKALKPGNTADAPDLSDKFLGADGGLSATLRKAITWNSLSLASTQDVTSRQLGYFYHDLSTCSAGLLTNTKWGGLRKDLSLLTEQEELPSSMQLSADQSANIFAEGPFWHDLRTYMRSYKPFDEGGLIEWKGDTPHYTLGPNWLEVVRRRGWQHRMPVVSKWLWVLSYFGKPVSDTESQLCMVVQPIMEVWNPFNLPLQMPADSHFDFKFWSFPMNLFVKVAGGGTPLVNRGIFYPVRENESHGDQGIAAPTVRYEINLKDQSGSPVAMQPGEAMLFSDGSNSPRLPSSKIIPLSRGLEIRGGTYSSNINHNSGKLNLPKNSAIEVYYGPRNEWFYSDNYFVGQGGYANEWAYQGDVMTQRSMNSTSSHFKPNNSYFSLSGTSITNPQPSLIVGAILRTEHSIPDPAEMGELTSSETTRFSPYLFSPLTLGQCDVRDNDPFKLETNPYVFFARRVTDFDDVHVALENDNGHLGRSHGAEGQTHVPLREIPIQPLTSLAQLQHAGLGHYAIKYDFEPKTAAELSDTSDAYDTNKLKPWHLRSHPNINMAFGNSFASPFIPQGSMEANGISPLGGGNGGQADFNVTLHDKSWKLNEVLWDDWFISGAGDWNHPLVADKRTRNEVITDFTAGIKPLPNKRYQANVPDSTTAANELQSSDGYQKLASYISSKGAFNVNSTSKHAWKAVLGGLDLSTRPLQYFDKTASTWENDPASDGYAFSRFTLPNGSSAEANGAGVNYWQQRWLGARKLTDVELDTLAGEIVQQVKLRGPFLSLGEFINRRLVNDDTGLEGALQTAIQNAGINAGFEADSVPLKPSSLQASYANSKAISDGQTGKGAPGYITQADVLMSIAPALTVRCDTFTIRAYGEAHDKNGDVIARAWCEAIVQRSPEYVDPSDPPSAASGTALKPTNQTFGRRFHITSFRWLSNDEI
ncbi:hypothetical protein [Oceaniferula spumae]